MGFDIVGISKYVPSKRVSNFDLEKIVDTSDEWIYERTGIKNRYYSENEGTFDLGYNAAKKLIRETQVNPKDIGAVIVPTFTADYLIPSVACLLQSKLGLSQEVFALDINGACTGFIYALKIADSLFESMSDDKYILVVGAELISKLLDFKDRSTCILFGDGAGAALLKRNKEKKNHYCIGARGTKEELFCTGVNKEKLLPYLTMDGKAVFKFAIKAIIKCVKEVLEKSGLKKDDIDYVVCHQANSRIIESVRRKLDISKEHFYVNIENYGNTSSASIPIVLAEMNEKNLLKNGMKIIMVGFGGGLTWGSVLVEW